MAMFSAGEVSHFEFIWFKNSPCFIFVSNLTGTVKNSPTIRDIDTTSQEIVFDALVPVYCNILVAFSRCTV